MINPIHLIIKWLAPYRCIHCSSEGALLCEWCRSNVPHVPAGCYRCGRPSISYATCAQCITGPTLKAVYRRTYYEGPIIKQLIWRLKYDRAQAAADEMAEMMVGSIKALPESSLVTHVPTAPARIRKRGYDQGALIAKKIGRLTHQTYESTLTRMSTSDQIGASRSQRLQQAKHSLAVKRPGHVVGRHILLVDDVMTTGATLEVAADILIQAGASSVSAVVFAFAAPSPKTTPSN